jgi:mono/diheme cytochrome c family protein
MKVLIKITLWIISLAILSILGILFYISFALPNVKDATELKVEITPDRVARGEYLANHVTVCIDCHSTRDWSRFSGPPTKGTFGMGGDLFDQKFGFPGAYYAKNITPAGIGDYSDGELFRTITTGVDKEGQALFPVMPFHYYGQMDEEDIKAIIAYIRTLPSIENKVPESKSDFPMNFLINTLPHEANITNRPKETDIVNYGKYLTNAAACIDCHTQFEKGSLVPGTEFGGGREFPFPDGSLLRSPNISPDEETGIGGWDEETFVSMFKAYSDSTTLNTKLNPGDFNSIMPWTMYGGMKEEDLKAIFTYLKTVTPIKNEVIKFVPASK